MHRETLAICWKDSESKNYTDVFPASAFEVEGRRPDLTHDVIGPLGGQYQAKCRLTIESTRADLDYTTFPTFNRQQGMYLGVLRIFFLDRDRTAINRAQWKYAGKKRFEEAQIHIVNYRLAKLKPYKPTAEIALKSTQQVRERPGQIRFRSRLKKAYGCRCCITACPVSEALEGAHIDPFTGSGSDHPQNGLLLRRDLHALFDAGLLAIEPITRLVYFAHSVLIWPEYKQLHTKVGLREPEPHHDSYRPDTQALKRRWQTFRMKENIGSTA